MSRLLVRTVAQVKPDEIVGLGFALVTQLRGHVFSRGSIVVTRDARAPEVAQVVVESVDEQIPGRPKPAPRWRVVFDPGAPAVLLLSTLIHLDGRE